MNVTSAFQGITTPIKDLFAEIHARGWEVVNVDTSDGVYVAKARNPHGDTVEKTGRDQATALANVLTHIVRKEFIRQGAWTSHWADQLEPIAQAYAKAPAYDPAAVSGWHELANDCAARAEALRQQLQVAYTHDPTPYPSPQDLWRDVEQKKRIQVSRAGADTHPVWSEDQVLNYRLVHDVLGHAAAGGDFGWTGENLATAAHMPYLSPSAQAALFTEAIGNSAYKTYHRGWGPPKITYLNEYLEPVQGEQNPAGHGGEPVGNTLAPGPLPTRKDAGYAEEMYPNEFGKQAQPTVVNANTNEDWYEMNRQPILWHKPSNQLFVGNLGASHGAIHKNYAESHGIHNDYALSGHPLQNEYWYGAMYHNPKRLVEYSTNEQPEAVSQALGVGFGLDPEGQDEEDWEPHQTDSEAQETYRRLMSGVKRDPNAGYETGIVPPAVNAVTAYGDPLDSIGLRDMAHRLDSGWAKFTTPEGKADFPRMKIAVMNALRAAILSPRKELRWNAVHYQDLSHIPHDHDDPKTYWDALENKRIEHNRGQGIPNPEIAHKAHYQSLLDFYRYYGKHHPDMSPSEVKQHADREVQIMQAEIEEKLWHEAKEPQLDVFEPKVYKMLDRRLKQIVKDEKPLLYTSAEEDVFNRPTRYGAFIGRQMIAIAKASRYADVLTEAALEDMKNNDGAGHHFRHVLLSLQIPYVGAKIASFAWLLLAPLTSQLATIDSHMADVLGNDRKKVTTRDYFRMERELQAGRDAAGYGHLPLGQFQWGMWDGKRTGWGTHQDHSPLRPWEPVPHHNVEWPPSVGITNQHKEEFMPPEWWAQTEPYRQNEVAKWNTEVAPYYTRDSVPWANHDAEVPV